MSGTGLCPAFVLDRVDGQPIWRLMQAQDGTPEVSPVGFGDGAYQPLPNVQTVVKIVGTTHVQGMVQRWADAVRAPLEIKDLVYDPEAVETLVNKPPAKADPEQTSAAQQQPSGSS